MNVPLYYVGVSNTPNNVVSINDASMKGADCFQQMLWTLIAMRHGHIIVPIYTTLGPKKHTQNNLILEKHLFVSILDRRVYISFGCLSIVSVECIVVDAVVVVVGVDGVVVG